MPKHFSAKWYIVTIINIDYLMIIKDSKCMLYPPFDKVTELLVSRKYKKELQDRFCL